MEIKNYTEVVVQQVLDEVLKSGRTSVCTCDKCKLDIMAKALNNLPTNYYVSQQGEVYSKLAATYTEFKTKVLTEVTKAIMHIQNEPRH